MTPEQIVERLVEAMDPALADLETRVCPVLSHAAEAAREALFQLLDVVALVEPTAAARAAGN